MPSLLDKLSYFDPETGATFVAAGDKFLWKEGKKNPEDSKVTKLVEQYGWRLQQGTDMWLLFKKKGDPGQLFVVRGNKRWFYELPAEHRFAMKGKGLDDLHEALRKDRFSSEVAKAACIAAEFCPQCNKDAAGCSCPNKGELLDGKTRADHLANGATAVNNAGNGHSSVDGDPLPEVHVYGSKLLQAKREIMHDDSGAQTGLRRRPDYGESDSYTSEMNEANAKGACLVLTGGVKTASGEEKRTMFVSAVNYERGFAFRLKGFHYSPDPRQAKVFMPRTAENLAKQIRVLCGQTPKIAKPGDLLTTQNIKTQKQPRKDLLTQHNLKTQKGESKGFLTGVMHMMPSDLAGYGNVCPCASPECRQMCLNTAGMWANAESVQNSRRMKTELYFKNRPQFMADMEKSINALVRKAEKNNLTPAVRINGTSDLPQVAMEMAKKFPQVQFYDYTKIPQPWKRQLPNYHITFSRSEINDKDTMEALEHGVNVAVVFSTPKGQPLPKEWRGYPVIDGDEHDLRFLDKLEQGGEGPLVIGLRGKGKAKGKDKGTDSGFVVDPKSLVNIAPAPKKAPEPKQDLVQIGQPPVESTKDRIQERTQPATQPEEGFEWDEENETKTSSAERKVSNEWFVEGCFDDAHLRV